jgi:hypothetical protein
MSLLCISAAQSCTVTQPTPECGSGDFGKSSVLLFQNVLLKILAWVFVDYGSIVINQDQENQDRCWNRDTELVDSGSHRS